ncbi:protein ACCELERATED CELL DEATH 6-like [Papaver somniferum]|nr:protein ACCELERATED CELL DEATH 6-like [Papaver somniferum]
MRPENDSVVHEMSFRKNCLNDLLNRDRNIILNTDQNVEEILPPKTPSPKLDSGTPVRSFVVVEYMSLYQSAQEGDWEKAQELFNGNPSSMTAIITIESDTALLVAADHKQWEFVEKLVRCMPQEALGLKETKFGYTALHIVAREGKTRIAEAMVTKNNNLTQIRDNEGRVPLLIASLFVSLGKKETIEYLLSVTKDENPSPLSGPDGAALMCNLLDADYYDIALSLFHRSPELVMEKAKNSNMWPLEVMAQRPFNFQSGSKLNFWQRSIYSMVHVDVPISTNSNNIDDPENPAVTAESSPTSRTMTILYWLCQVPGIKHLYKQIYKQKSMHGHASSLVKGMFAQLNQMTTEAEEADFFENSGVLKTAIKFGTTELVEECLKEFPYLIWTKMMKNQTLIQMAIEERNENILNLMCKISEEDKNELVSRKDKDGNGVLHYAAKLAPFPRLNLVSGAALQMQREMQWFKGVKNMVLKSERLVRNKDGFTAQSIFTTQHKELMREGEKWMKDTAQSCMLVAALIATVVFAAAFTVPGGNFNNDESSDRGIPIFLNENSFMIFAIADALALFSSITSILMFLAILTSRYAEEDFLLSLPTKLILGLATLFFSIVTMMVAFGAALDIVLVHRLRWVPIPIVLFGFVPVTLFALLQFPLLVTMVSSTYWPHIFGKQSKHMFRLSNS